MLNNQKASHSLSPYGVLPKIASFSPYFFQKFSPMSPRGHRVTCALIK